jgi:acyl-coenzyme A thioesterase PaaI-like protein
MSEMARRARIEHLEALPRFRTGETNFDEDRIFCRACAERKVCHLGADLRRDTSNAGITGTVHYGEWAEGGGGVVHGGMVLAVFDELMSSVFSQTGVLAVTLSLQASFHKPVPIEQVIDLRAWPVETDDRRLRAEATMSSAGHVLASATADFLARDPARHFEWATRNDPARMADGASEAREDGPEADS